MRMMYPSYGCVVHFSKHVVSFLTNELENKPEGKKNSQCLRFLSPEEIKSVRKLSTEFVRSSNNSSSNTGFVYILVPFNEPGT